MQHSILRHAVVVCVLIAGSTCFADPKPVTPGKVHEVAAKDGPQEIKVQVNDILEIQIPNPALPKMVTELKLEAEGDAILAGAANTVNPKGPAGGRRISIFVGFKGTARSGTVTFSYKDGSGKVHEGKVIAQVIKEDK
jgi:hypothetical protein